MESSNSIKISNFYPRSVTGKLGDSFVGVKKKGNDIYFYYPESYNFKVENNKNLRNDILDLLRTIAIAKKKSSDKNEIHDIYIADAEFALNSYLWLINDYLDNGFYINREKVYKINQNGRINWKRTMQQQPIISKGNIIYKNITVDVNSNTDNLMIEIHKYCLKKSINFIGWLFNLSSNFIEMKPYNDNVKSLYIKVVELELDKTFEDTKKIRLIHILNVLRGLDSNAQSEDFVYGVDSYYYIFEKMIDAIFGTEKNLKNFNPKASWHLIRNNYELEDSSELHPDTILILDNVAYIIDSKFYRYGYTGKINDLPRTTSIQKQITYGEYIKKNNLSQVDNIYSVFILPFDKTRDKFQTSNNLVYLGFAKAEWMDNTQNDRDHQFIYTFLIDLKYVIKTWNNFSHTRDRNELTRIIREESSKIKDFL